MLETHHIALLSLIKYLGISDLKRGVSLSIIASHSQGVHFSLVLNRERSCPYNLFESLHRTLPMREVCKSVLSRVSLPALNHFKSVIRQPTSLGPREAAGVVTVQTPRREQQGPGKSHPSSEVRRREETPSALSRVRPRAIGRGRPRWGGAPPLLSLLNHTSLSPGNRRTRKYCLADSLGRAPCSPVTLTRN